MNDTPLYFDMDRRIPVNPRDFSSPLPDAEYPWFSTRYPVKVTLQAVSHGRPAIVAQQPLKVVLSRGTTTYCILWAVSGQNPWFAVPSLAVTPGPLNVEVRDGLDNAVLQFRTLCLDAVPENPADIPDLYSNPTSVRIKDEGERLVTQPVARHIRLQRDATLFIVDDITEGMDTWVMRLDYGSLQTGMYYDCNRILVKAPKAIGVTCPIATLNVDGLPSGWTTGRITVLPDSSTRIDFYL